MKHYQYLFFDADDTLLDFHQAEAFALKECFIQNQIPYTAEIRSRYEVINRELWKKLERGEVTRDYLLLQRFAQLFQEFRLPADADVCRRQYQKNLSLQAPLMPGARELLEALSPSYPLLLATNGVATTQRSRLRISGLDVYFREIFISEEIGFSKPDPRFFAYCFSRIPDISPENCLFIGDSPTADMAGAAAAGMDTCYVRSRPNSPDLPNITMEIYHLDELRKLL